MSNLVLYTNPMSRAIAIEWMLAELNIDCERKVLEYGTSMKSEEYLRINPFGKVPTLVDGDVAIHETGAICAYLADKFADKNLAPALNDPKRGLYFCLLFMAAGPLEAAITNQVLGLNITPEQKKFVGYGSVQEVLNAVEQKLENAGPYLCGAQFTAADVYMGGFLEFYASQKLIPISDALETYLTVIRERPAHQKAYANQ